uniref:Uncharacterized protein n=2 Tax=Lygus hesperus TaxID=30085 RepID=A0A146KXA0_LYGHE
MFDVAATLSSTDEDLYVYIFDSHRPYVLENLHNSHHRIRVLCSELDDTVDLPSPLSVQCLEQISHSAAVPSALLGKLQKLEAYYSHRYCVGSTSCMVLDMLYLLGHHTCNAVWWAAVGITYNFLFEYVDGSVYETVYVRLRTLLADFDSAAAAGSGADGTTLVATDASYGTLTNEPFRRRHGVYVQRAFIFPLLRFWTLYDAVAYTRQCVGSLRLWTDRGERELKR